MSIATSTPGATTELHFQRHRTDIVRYLNPQAIIFHLHSLLNETEWKHISQLLENGSCSATRKQCAEEIVCVVEKSAIEKGTGVYQCFLQCIKEEQTHMGHSYIATFLQGEGDRLENDPQVRESQRMEQDVSMDLEQLTDIDLYGLIPYLIEAGLLTDAESVLLTSTSKTREEKFFSFINLLNTKGPKSYYIFAQCLKRETQHPRHSELYQWMTTGNTKNRKRRKSDPTESLFPVVKVSKQSETPEALVAEELLPRKEYLQIMTIMRKRHLNGEWELAEKLLCVSMASTTLNEESKIAIKLESCTGFISRRIEDVVVTRVEEARSEAKCLSTTSNSYHTLLGRCEWVLAKLYRYVGKFSEAKEHIENAMRLHLNTKPGEDTALTNYCCACILLEQLAKNNSEEEADTAKFHLNMAIQQARSGDYGLDLSHPHIRLAQLCLGSSPTHPGCRTDKDGLEEASKSLKAVTCDSIAPRTKCIYHYTYSDYYRNSGEREKAIESAKTALKIAEEHGFKTEIESVQLRLSFIRSSESC